MSAHQAFCRHMLHASKWLPYASLQLRVNLHLLTACYILTAVQAICDASASLLVRLGPDWAVRSLVPSLRSNLVSLRRMMMHPCMEVYSAKHSAARDWTVSRSWQHGAMVLGMETSSHCHTTDQCNGSCLCL